MKLHIMVFDDDEDIRNLLKTALVSKGHEVTALADPSEFPFFNEETCTCSPDQQPCADILIADNVMPNIEGIDFFKKLKEKGCLPLIRENVAIMSEIYDWIDECKIRIEASRISADN